VHLINLKWLLGVAQGLSGVSTVAWAPWIKDAGGEGRNSEDPTCGHRTLMLGL